MLPTDDAQTWGVPTEAFVPGDEYTWVFDEPGTYAYYCSIHGTKDVGMVGTVIVTDGADSTRRALRPRHSARPRSTKGTPTP